MNSTPTSRSSRRHSQYTDGSPSSPGPTPAGGADGATRRSPGTTTRARRRSGVASPPSLVRSSLDTTANGAQHHNNGPNLPPPQTGVGGRGGETPPKHPSHEQHSVEAHPGASPSSSNKGGLVRRASASGRSRDADFDDIATSDGGPEEDERAVRVHHHSRSISVDKTGGGTVVAHRTTIASGGAAQSNPSGEPVIAADTGSSRDAPPTAAARPAEKPTTSEASPLPLHSGAAQVRVEGDAEPPTPVPHYSPCAQSTQPEFTGEDATASRDCGTDDDGGGHGHEPPKPSLPPAARFEVEEEPRYNPRPCIHGHTAPAVGDSYLNTYPRTHGLTRPFHVLQIIAWAVKVVLGVGTGVVTTRALINHADPVLVAPLQLLMYLLMVIAYGTGLAASLVDPTDRADKGASYCGACERSVHDDSKHCKLCNRCCYKFDHHCKWLNNCIGERNYWLFYTYVSTLLLVIGVGWSTTLFLLVDHAAEELHVAEIVFGALLLLLYTLASIPLLHLCGFHIFLRCSGHTTYSWLMRPNQ